MRKKEALISLLGGLVDLLADESARDPEFAEKLEKLLLSLPERKVKGSAKIPGMNRVNADLPDIHQEWNIRGEADFRLWLREQPIPLLRAIIRAQDIDSQRRTSKWKEAEKLADFITDNLRARMSRGSAFIGRALDEQKRKFPVNICKERIAVECAGTAAGFWLSPDRASHGLSGVTLCLHNHLPFDIEMKFRRLEVNIDSNRVLDSPLNAVQKLPESNGARLMLPEIALSDRQMQWLTNLKREFVSLHMTLYWSVVSSICNWEQSQQIDCTATIHM